nr:hypothetical protein [Tanacetum cinerariifolium]
MALLSMRADKFWKKTEKKISIQRIDVTRFDNLKVECFNYHKMGHFVRKCKAPRSQDRGRRDNYRQGSKVEEQAPKALMAIDEVGWDWSYMENDEENHAVVAEKEAPTEFALMANTSAESKVFDNSLCSKECKKNTDSLNSFQTASKDLDSLLESQRLDKNKKGLGYNDVPPLPAQLYSSLKKDLSWTGLPEFKDDTMTDYSRPAPTEESSPNGAQNRNPSVTKEASPSTILPKSFIKFFKANDSLTKSKIDKAEKAKKSPVNGNSNPTATSTNPPANQLETLIVETPTPIISSLVPTACFTDSPKPSRDARLISKRVANQVETPSLGNILTMANRFEDI